MQKLQTPPKGGASLNRDWTEGSILGSLWSLSWPMIISSLLLNLGPTIDMIWVGKLGSTAIAGVGVSGMVVMVVNGLIMGLFTSLRAMLARFVGAKDEHAASHVTQQAFVIGIAFSLFMAIIGIFLAKPILIMMGVEADVVAEGAAYLRIQFVGVITLALLTVTQTVMQASGDAVTPMKISIAYRFFHIALSPFLIFGWWIFPRLGVSGSAITSVFSQGIGGALGLWVLFTGRTRMRISLSNFRLDGNVIWRMVKIGIPASLNSMERSLANVVLMWFIVPFGTLSVAAHSIMTRVESFIQMPAMGLGQASGVLAGQNLGAGKPERAEKTGWLAAIWFTGVMLIGSVALWFWAEPIVRVFNSEPGLVKITSAFARIQIWSYFAYGFSLVLSQCLNGVGDTMIPLAIALSTMWLVQVPMSYFLPRHTNLGVYGVRWGIVAGIAMRGVISAVYFKLGRWKRKKV
jgi:putative MATE family efflux protein